MELVTALVELYKRAETQLPEDVVNALKESLKKEDNPLAAGILKMLIKNAEMANESRRPICQDTGMPTFYVKYNGKLMHQNEIEKAISEATKRAIKEVPLRVRFLEPFSGEGEEYNIYGTPIIYFEEWNKNYLHFDLLCQGAGSENVSKHYSLPDDELKAARDLDGVRKCIIDTVKEAQGKGCPPGIVGVAVGSDRESCARHSKLQLLRRLDDKNPNKKLDEFEKKMKKELNWLGIGPMGLGGRTTVLGVKIIFLQRYTASFFVDVNYNCWRLCRGKMNFKKGVATYE
jgi:fumarate hydratase class I